MPVFYPLIHQSHLTLFILAPVALLNYDGGCGTTLLDNFGCDGSEGRISDCDSDFVNSAGGCDHFTNAGVRCLNGEYIEISSDLECTC